MACGKIGKNTIHTITWIDMDQYVFEWSRQATTFNLWVYHQISNQPSMAKLGSKVDGYCGWNRTWLNRLGISHLGFLPFEHPCCNRACYLHMLLSHIIHVTWKCHMKYCDWNCTWVNRLGISYLGFLLWSGMLLGFAIWRYYLGMPLDIFHSNFCMGILYLPFGHSKWMK